MITAVIVTHTTLTTTAIHQVTMNGMISIKAMKCTIEQTTVAVVDQITMEIRTAEEMVTHSLVTGIL